MVAMETLNYGKVLQKLQIPPGFEPDNPRIQGLDATEERH